MQDLLEILYDAKSTGTPTGSSYYGCRCPRKARLDKEYGSEESSYEAKRGTTFHKLMELYHLSRLASEALPVTDKDPDEDPIAEGLRLFAGYQRYFGPDSLGRVIGCEIKFPADGDARQIALLTEALGVPFTGQIDMLTEVVEPVKGLDLIPGFYLVDYKTTSKRDSKANLKYSIRPQFTEYMVAWNALVPEHKVQGLIVQEAIGNKKLDESCFRRFYVPAPAEATVDGLRSWLKWKAEWLKTDQINLDACTDWSVCHHYKSGRCLQI